MTEFTLEHLQTIIAQKADADPQSSWTAKLLADGPKGAAQKLGEEATETIVAALSEDKQAFIGESADLLYHWLVLAHAKGVTLEEVLAELQSRTAQSGLAEKASRKAK
ncbi:MAG: phosphoribosyl-ATP diphosphatase [Pseudomonadota bacterium]